MKSWNTPLPRKCSDPCFKSADSDIIIIIKQKGKAVQVLPLFRFFIQIPQITNTAPLPLWCTLSFGLKGEHVGSFSRSEDQPTTSRMYSLCAEFSWRQSFFSGAGPRYYIRFPREHTLIAGLLSITGLKISPFSRDSRTIYLLFISRSYFNHSF